MIPNSNSISPELGLGICILKVVQATSGNVHPLQFVSFQSIQFEEEQAPQGPFILALANWISIFYMETSSLTLY